MAFRTVLQRPGAQWVRGMATRVPEAPYDVLFCGTDLFARAALERLVARTELYKSIQVLTPPDVAHAWGGKRMRVSPVKQLAQEHKLPHEQVPENGMDSYALPEALQASAAPLLLTASFGHMIPQALLSRFASPSQTLNLHPSLLPLLRGAAPIQWAIARQYSTTGVSVQQLAPQHFDTGNVLGQVSVPVPDGCTYESLATKLSAVGADLLVDVIANLRRCDQEAWPQASAEATRAPKLKKSVAVVHWDKWDADKIDARMRAFGGQYPLTTTLVPAKAAFPRVSVLLREGSSLRRTGQGSLGEQDAEAAAALQDQPPGTATYSPILDAVAVRCAAHEDNVYLVTNTEG
ncbi:methionyl-tRNA formyltransferase [Malassezia obtusa]|uniref:methionyl-tRNA formyltransferase n=1 Tax=Malassezia obtusa TaxID=76774 RepID=A0AAF0DZ06_9BASI|nr:methionyl-tRNA formyltransferase [Malassezia obtusa]